MSRKKNLFIHPNAIVEPHAKIGNNSRIWAFVHILPGAVIGADCNICDGVFVENDVIVGDRVTVKCGVQLWDGVRLDDDVFVGPNVSFTNDPFPRSKPSSWTCLKTVVRKGASIGANATILPGIEIGSHAMVGAGSVVTRDVPQNAVVVGNPARIKGYVSSFSKKPISKSTLTLESSINPTKVPGVNVYKLPGVSDIRGELSFGEYDKHLPFLPKRYFIIYAVPTKEVRGEHVHKTLHEFLVCLQGSVNVVVDNGNVQDEIILNNSRMGLHLPPLTWTVQYQYSSDAILLVLASEVYEAEDYIRNYDEYLAYIRSLENQ
jgi:acetyltransferase-like isoleucine patch superfamily enzyme/dTDP-4-dehydrorhamnose 3,5-epimerase-like enzyme